MEPGAGKAAVHDEEDAAQGTKKEVGGRKAEELVRRS